MIDKQISLTIYYYYNRGGFSRDFNEYINIGEFISNILYYYHNHYIIIIPYFGFDNLCVQHGYPKHGALV